MTRPRRPGIRVPWDIPIEDFGFCLCDGDFGDLALASGVGSAERAIRVVTVDDLELAGAFDQAAPSYDRMVSRNPLSPRARCCGPCARRMCCQFAGAHPASRS